MDKAVLENIRGSARQIGQAVDRLAKYLPRAGEPSEVYAVRARVCSDDLRTATVRLARGETVWVLYLETAVDTRRVYDEVLRPLQETALLGTLPPAGTGHSILPQARAVKTVDDQASALVDGWAVVFAGGSVVAVDVQSFPVRNVSQPTTEQAIMGSKEAFIEDVQSNIGAVRRRLRDPQLRVETFTVGARSRTVVALLHLDGVTDPDLVERTRRGLAAIDTDFVRTNNDVSAFLFQRGLTTPPLAEQTERPDRAANAIAAGRLCLVVDGSPFALLVPTTLMETVKDSESALPGGVNPSFVRVVRVIGEGVSVSAAGLYVALLTADIQVLPTPLALAVSASRNGVPYPVLTETLIMLLIIDVFSEAMSQAPSGLGNALSIVGTLIIGEMAVQARLASSLMMIVVAATALGSFLTLKFPYSYTLRVWKYPITLLAGVGGLFGWLAGLLLLGTHLASLKSAGVPYLSPVGPLDQRTLFQSGITQAPRSALTHRSGVWDPQDLRRAGDTGQ